MAHECSSLPKRTRAEASDYILDCEFRIKTYKRHLVFLVVLLFAFAGATAKAQSTIFNVPTTDTVMKGKGYFEFDYLRQAPGTDTTRTHIINPRLVAGIASNVEAGANFLTAHSTHRALFCGASSTCG